MSLLPARAIRMARLGLPTPEAPPSRPCPNCGTTVEDLFCGHCGQRNATRLVSVRNMLMDALEDQLSVNSALPRTLAGLLFRPGFLTREYVEGRIVRYMAPFRLYLVTSVLFFLGLSLTPPAVGTLKVQPAWLGLLLRADLHGARHRGHYRSFGVVH
ncbi:hypothetical protein BH23GEM5_BH23GEM5_24440 [soil metagenome]